MHWSYLTILVLLVLIPFALFWPTREGVDSMKVLLRKGKCENCGFRGLLHRKMFTPAAELDKLSANPMGEIYAREMDVCVTCAETPSSIVSPNVRHKRYPEAEYAKDREKESK